MCKTKKQRAIKVIIEIFSVLAIGVLYYAFIKIVGKAIPCIFNVITGWYCPGCGATRMCLALLRFDFKAAFHYNPVLLIILPFLLEIYLSNRINYVKTGKNINSKLEDILLIVILVALLVFCVIRNVFSLHI